MKYDTRYKDVPHGLMFHHFHGGEITTSEGSISADQFGDILTYIGLERIWRADEWLKSAVNGTLPDNAVCVTFDDGLYSQFKIAWPVLREFNLTAFWFPHTSTLSGTCDQLELYRYIRNYCFESILDFYAIFEQHVRENWRSDMESGLARFRHEDYYKNCPFFSELDKRFRYLRDEVLGPVRYSRVMDQLCSEVGVNTETVTTELFINLDDWATLIQDGNVLGLHSHTHPTRLAELPLQEQKLEYDTNFAELAEKLHYRPDIVAHPCGSFTEKTLDILKALGVNIGFCANMCRPKARGLEYPRQNHANILMDITQHDII